MTSTNARKLVLAAVRDALRVPSPGADGATAASPAPALTERPHMDGEALIRSFSSEMEALGGVACTAPDPQMCAATIRETMLSRSLHVMAVQSSPLALSVAGCLSDCEVLTASDLDKSRLAGVDCSLLEARALLADSGSAVVLARGAADRMLAFLPRACFIVCEASNVHAGMSEDALRCIEEAARAGARGEAVIITGPSRTADIEKILVLGAHGPGFVMVLIVAKAQRT